jgi:hypothetical protein
VTGTLDDEALLKVVRDGQAEAALRREAATNLFDRGSAQSEQSLLAELKLTVDPSLRRAIIQGLKCSRKPSASAGAVLLSLAKDLDAVMLEDAADVLGRSMEPGQIRNIATLAADRDLQVNTRVIATSALGYHRTQSAAKAVIPLIESTQPAEVRAAAFTALGRLSGLDDNGSDRARWHAWWSQAKAMSPTAWQDHLLANFARRGDVLARQRAVLQERLTTALRQRYRAVAKDERETVLIAMLADPIDAVRELSLELVREVVNSEQVGGTLTAALLTRLDDTSPIIRTGATLLLRDLKHAGAADVVAQRLAEGTEKDASVLRAYLLMMKRQPRLAAVGPAIVLLDDPTVRGEAAGVILAAFDHSPRLVGRDQAERVAETLRAQLSADSPEPRFIELLGRVASPDDWARIAQWLDHDVDAVKEAAARTWAVSDRTLAPLAQRAGDPIIQAIVIPAATQRGQTPETLFGLIEHRPKSEQFAAAWGRALVAMAGRIDDPDAIVNADARLQKQNESTDLRLQLLSAAIDRLLLRLPAEVIGNGSERQVFTIQLIDLLLARAEVRLASGDTKASIADLDRVTALKVDLALSQQQRHELIGLHARVMAGELDDAFAKAGKYFNGEPDSDEAAAMRTKVINLLLSCADRCVSGKQIERAGQIISRLRSRIPRPVPLELETRLAAVEMRIKAGQ